MSKKVIKEMDLNDMIAGGHSSDAYPEYHRQILSGLLNEDSEQITQQHPASSVKLEQETGEHRKESTETPKQTDKKHHRTSLEEYRQTFLHAPRIIDRKPVFLSASTREQLDRIVRQLGDRKRAFPD